MFYFIGLFGLIVYGIFWLWRICAIGLGICPHEGGSITSVSILGIPTFVFMLMTVIGGCNLTPQKLETTIISSVVTNSTLYVTYIYADPIVKTIQCAVCITDKARYVMADPKDLMIDAEAKLGRVGSGIIEFKCKIKIKE